MPAGQRVQRVRHRKYPRLRDVSVAKDSGPDINIAQDEFETDVRSYAGIRVLLCITFRPNEDVYGMQAFTKRRGGRLLKWGGLAGALAYRQDPRTFYDRQLA